MSCGGYCIVSYNHDTHIGDGSCDDDVDNDNEERLLTDHECHNGPGTRVVCVRVVVVAVVGGGPR